MPRQSENLLTDTAIRKAESKAKPYKIFDGKGLFVLVKPNGGKYFGSICVKCWSLQSIAEIPRRND